MLTNGMYTWPVRNPNEPPIYIHRPPLEKYRYITEGRRSLFLSSALQCASLSQLNASHCNYNTDSAFCECRSTLDGLLQIVRKEGVRVLYRGMDLNLLVGVPMVGLV